MKLYQVYKYSKICRKYKNELCRYGFGRISTERTIVSEPLEDNIKKQDNILSKVSAFINPFLNLGMDTFMKDLSVESISLELQITKYIYYWTLSASGNNN